MSRGCLLLLLPWPPPQVWTVLVLAAGFLFGNLPVVQHNFTAVVLGIVAVSVLPVVAEVVAARREQGRQQPGQLWGFDAQGGRQHLS